MCIEGQKNGMPSADVIANADAPSVQQQQQQQQPPLENETLVKVAEEQARRHEEARVERRKDFNLLDRSGREKAVEIPLDYWEDFTTPIVVSQPPIEEKLREINPLLKAVVTAKAVGGLEPQESLPFLAAEQADADARAALIVCEQKEEAAKSELTCADRTAKVQYMVGITATQKRLMADDADYRKDMEAELRNEQRVRATKTEQKLATARIELNRFTYEEGIRTLRAVEELEAVVDDLRYKRALHAAEMERCDAQIKRAKQMAKRASELLAPSIIDQ